MDHIDRMLDRILELQKENQRLRAVMANLRLSALMREEIIDYLQEKLNENDRQSIETTQRRTKIQR
ncbi:MAG: hypothetical protein RLZZ86_265 [Cyanobacteriota bacterium]|jgi:hypothetical protein